MDIVSPILNMIYVNVTTELKKFEADIRGLCMAFFPYQKFSFIYDDSIKEKSCKSDVIINGY